MERASLKRRRARGVTRIKVEPISSSQPDDMRTAINTAAPAAAAAAAIDTPAACTIRQTPPANMSDTDATRCTDSENEYQARKRARGRKDAVPAPNNKLNADRDSEYQSGARTNQTEDKFEAAPETG